jgi:hypothetical protein
MYNPAMGWKMMRVCCCDICGHTWISSVPHPTLCASKKCRSTLWDKGGVDGRTKEARSKKKRSLKTPKP